MKITDKKKPVHTIPSGVWESSRPDKTEKKDKDVNRLTTDLQGNGYPVNRKED